MGISPFFPNLGSGAVESSNIETLGFSRYLTEGREWPLSWGPNICTVGISLEALNFAKGCFAQLSIRGVSVVEGFTTPEILINLGPPIIHWRKEYRVSPAGK